MAQIYVNNVLAKPKAIHVYDELAQQWKRNRVGYVYHGGAWIPFVQYSLDLYNAGVFGVSFVTTNTVGGNMTNYANRFTLSAVNSQYITFITNALIDLTNYEKLKIDWSTTTDASQSQARSLIGITNDASPGPIATTNYVVFNQKTGSFNREVTEIDVSSLSGYYYIATRAHNSAFTATTMSVSVYKIWLE